MTLESSITISDTLFVQEVDDEIVILDTNTQEYFNLTGVGKVIWNLFEDTKSLKEVHAKMLERFDIESDTLEYDLLNFIKELETKKLITYKN
jgi:uncharacterized protein (UPF0332 family)